MKSLPIALVVALLASSTAGAERSPEELEAKLKEVEKERDALKAKVAALQLEIMKLKEASEKGTTAGDGGKADDDATPEKPNQWKVKFLTSAIVQTEDIKQKVKDSERRVSDMEFQLFRAKSDLRSAEFSAKNFAKPGEKTGLLEKRSAVTKLELQIRDERAKLKELQQEAAESGKIYHVTCEEVAGGKLLTFVAKGSLIATVDTMKAGETYLVESRKRGDTLLLTKVAAER